VQHGHQFIHISVLIAWPSMMDLLRNKRCVGETLIAKIYRTAGDTTANYD